MTVCVATLFSWNYGTIEEPNYGVAAMTASDQMITSGDNQYESRQQKVALINPTTLLLIAGDYSVHSEALIAVQNQIKGDPNISPQRSALIYGQEIQRVRRREAEDLFLSPLGLNTDSFLSQQKDMSDSFVEKITNQLQNFAWKDVEALVVGSDKNSVHIYYVDSNGSSHCMDDVSFHAIGIGAWHAKSALMQSGYARQKNGYHESLALIYSAKRRAEIAPGVGAKTDVHVVLRDREFGLDDEEIKILEKIYKQHSATTTKLASTSIRKLHEAMNAKAAKNITTQDDPKHNGGPSQNAAQTPQENEGSSGVR